MKRVLYVFIFIISFFIVYEVKADYEATVLNPGGAKCDLYGGSTGYCFYSNSNLNNYAQGVIWLDTGDDVTVIEGKDIDSPNKELCKDYYVYTSYYFPKKNNTYYGYYCHDNLSVGSSLTEEFRTLFKDAGFPESYFEGLAFLKKSHPNWEFKAINTDLEFNDVVLNQSYGVKSLLRGSMSNNYAYLSIALDSFDYINNRFIAYDDKTGSDPWYKVNTSAIAYYLDPRNFLFNTDIFQFKGLSYNEKIEEERLRNSINSIFADDYLCRFTDSFIEAGKQSKVDPVYLASLSKEEIANGAEPGAAINGIYNSKYNFYNIGAFSGSDPVYNGLNFAANTDETTLRPWDTEEKAIVDGAIWIYNNYVKPGQDTSYFKRFNVVYNYLNSIGVTPTYVNYDHQYMQNLQAPLSESVTAYRSYANNNMLDLSYTFYIPVYKNMPEKTSLPEKKGWPNNYLKSMKIMDTNVVDFNSEVTEYNYNLDINIPKIKIEAEPVSSLARVEGTGTFEIKENTTKEITVTAQNGDVKKYKLNINLTGIKLEDPVDVKTTLNNAGIKNGDKYISGLTVGSDISIIKEKIINANSSTQVTLKNSSDAIKNNGVVATGDKIIISLNGEEKIYELVVYGDVTGDGKIMASDYKKIKDFIMGTVNLSGAYKEAADIDKNGKIMASDYKRIKDFIMGGTVINQ